MNHIISHDSEILAVGKQVITACAFIHYNFDGVEKVFLPKRATAKKFLPGVFELPGGHIEFGEDMVDGLKREIEEEFESQVTVGDPFAVFTYTNEIRGSHSIEVIYFARFINPIEKIKMHSEDHSEYRWIAENEIDKVIDNNKRADDPEIEAIVKGFDLLIGSQINFG